MNPFDNQRKKSKRRPEPPVPPREKPLERISITVWRYMPEELEILEDADLDMVEAALNVGEDSRIIWIHVCGIHRPEVATAICNRFDVNPLVLEDILNPEHRPKLEIGDEYFFTVLKDLRYAEATESVEPEQVSVVCGEAFVLSFQEDGANIFDPVKRRIRKRSGRIREFGTAYLAYVLIDTIVDRYFPVMEVLEAEVERVEEELIEAPDSDTLASIYLLKRRILTARKAVWPVREMAARLEASDSDIIHDGMSIFLKDLDDHLKKVAEDLDNLRETASYFLAFYHSVISNRLNEVMKLLTLISTIFIPLSFIAGVYGMNFEQMPELKWRWGYPMVLGVMLAVVVLMLGFFRKKRWL